MSLAKYQVELRGTRFSLERNPNAALRVDSRKIEISFQLLENRRLCMNFRPIAAALALSLLSGPAFAQTTAATGSDAMMAGPGMTMGRAAEMPLKYVTIQSNDLVTSKLIGLNICNKQNEEIGTISDVVVGGGKSVIGIVASVGGFLGMGESYVVLDPSSVALADQDGTWKAFVDTSKDDLSKAPKLDYSKFKK